MASRHWSSLVGSAMRPSRTAQVKPPTLAREEGLSGRGGLAHHQHRQDWRLEDIRSDGLQRLELDTPEPPV
jgi:hypothetical protein